MKKPALILLTMFILPLTACGGASNIADPASAPPAGASAEALPATTQIIIGTIKLEGTDQAVTAEQAAELLPLWQTMLVLANSDTAAEQEKEALSAQIQETMTSEQMQAITGLNLTRADMMSIMQQQGMARSGSSISDSQSADSSSGRVFGPGSGGPPDEMPMPGGGGFGPSGQGQNLSEDAIATAQASRPADANFIPPMLIDAVIEYLREKAGS